MPETLIPIVAIIGGVAARTRLRLARSSVLLLATVAMALVGVSALAYIKRRPQGKHLEVHVETLDRDLVFFMIFFSFALLIGILGARRTIEIAGGIICLLAYFYYVYRTIRSGGDVAESHEMDPLIMDRRADKEGGPPNTLMIIQLLLGLFAMVGGAHLFVHELLTVAESLGVARSFSR